MGNDTPEFELQPDRGEVTALGRCELGLLCVDLGHIVPHGESELLILYQQ